MTTLQLLHVIGVSLWLGIVGVELIMERGRARGREVGYAVARFHFMTDLFLEIPAITLVLVTGALMLDPTRLHGEYLAKVACGLLAVTMNAVSVVPVVLRKLAADDNRLEDVVRYSRWIDWTVPVGGPAALIALWIGGSWLAR